MDGAAVGRVRKLKQMVIVMRAMLLLLIVLLLCCVSLVASDNPCNVHTCGNNALVLLFSSRLCVACFLVVLLRITIKQPTFQPHFDVFAVPV